MERVRGIEPLASDWKSEVLPLYDTRLFLNSTMLVGALGIEPSLYGPKPYVLPVYDAPCKPPLLHKTAAKVNHWPYALFLTSLPAYELVI